MSTETTTFGRCPDCQVPAGFPHEQGCDVAVCVLTGQQRLTCSAFADEGMDVPNGNGGMVHIGATHPGQTCTGDTWTGVWPGITECREFGWYARFVPNVGFIPCGKDDPEASEDLNRLAVDAKWDRDQRRYVLR